MGPLLVKIQSAADSDKVNIVKSNLQKMSTAAVDKRRVKKFYHHDHGLFTRKLHIVLIALAVKASRIILKKERFHKIFENMKD